MSEPNHKEPVRQRIVETALRLFYADGVRATGIDRIIAESGVAKMSFYRHFPSKTDLVCAFLDERHRRWMEWFEDAVARHSGSRKPKLVAAGDAMADWFADPDFRGCAFINVTSEVPDATTRERRIVLRHKRELEQRLAEFARQDGHADADDIGRLALLIVDGAIVQAQIKGAHPATRDLRACLARFTLPARPVRRNARRAGTRDIASRAT